MAVSSPKPLPVSVIEDMTRSLKLTSTSVGKIRAKIPVVRTRFLEVDSLSQWWREAMEELSASTSHQVELTVCFEVNTDVNKGGTRRGGSRLAQLPLSSGRYHRG